MKRKLSSTSSEASILDDNDERGGVDDQVQPASALVLEQNIGSAESGGFLPAPHLAQSLGMLPGEMIFRSMFYDTPQASHISCLVAQLLNEQEVLLSLQLGEGTSFAVQSRSDVDTLALMEYNAATIQALMDSVEVPSFAVVPEVVVGESDAMYCQASCAPEAVTAEDVGTVFGQAPGVTEQGASASDEGFILAPDLALRLGMYPEQTLRRSMFYGTTQSNIVLEMVNQLSEIRENLLRNQELERAGLISEGIGVGCEDTASLIATNEELILALMSSIEAPVVAPAVVVIDSEEELVEETVKQDTMVAKSGKKVVVLGEISAEKMEEIRIRSAEIVRGLIEEKAARVRVSQERKVARELKKKEERQLAEAARELEQQRMEADKELARQEGEVLPEIREMTEEEEAAELERVEIARKERLVRAEIAREERLAIANARVKEQREARERERLEKLGKMKERQQKKEAEEKEKLERIKARERRKEERAKEVELRVQKREARLRAGELEIVLREERARYLYSSAAIDLRVGVTVEEVNLELSREIERERQLRLELGQVVARIKELKREMGIAMDRGMHKMVLELDRDIALAKLREVEIKIDMVKVKERKKQLSQELNRLSSIGS
ncbi:hypothetical protein [Candidatus Ichthyocystis sparus]|uniref:hypothetical protein n=1 Tax=Candidatus Ichthyocystis sparus TaxID=1561004 RepID=UPI000B87CD19|nr:hypothetical protein [Candidatus Ichthyocystis sparus]